MTFLAEYRELPANATDFDIYQDGAPYAYSDDVMILPSTAVAIYGVSSFILALAPTLIYMFAGLFNQNA